MSGGQRQRVALARALLRDAPVLVLDEPTTGLDPVAVRRLHGLLRTLAAGRTLIVITHDVGLAAASDDVLVLGDHQPARLLAARLQPSRPVTG